MIKYKLFQVKKNLTRDYGFMGLSFMKSMDVEFSLDNYDLVYDGSIETPASSALEELFEIFNTKHPKDFYGRSMSVSDVVQIGYAYFYCDSFGWVNIKNSIEN